MLILNVSSWFCTQAIEALSLWWALFIEATSVDAATILIRKVIRELVYGAKFKLVLRKRLGVVQCSSPFPGVTE